METSEASGANFKNEQRDRQRRENAYVFASLVIILVLWPTALGDFLGGHQGLRISQARLPAGHHDGVRQGEARPAGPRVITSVIPVRVAAISALTPGLAQGVGAVEAVGPPFTIDAASPALIAPVDGLAPVVTGGPYRGNDDGDLIIAPVTPIVSGGGDPVAPVDPGVTPPVDGGGGSGAVPEPQVWAMLILGLFGAGARLRSRATRSMRMAVQA